MIPPPVVVERSLLGMGFPLKLKGNKQLDGKLDSRSGSETRNGSWGKYPPWSFPFVIAYLGSGVTEELGF